MKRGSMRAENPAPAPASSRMDHNRRALVDAMRLVPFDRPLVYLDYPVHLNIGDILIMKGTEQLFDELGYEVAGRYGWMNFRRSAQDAVGERTTILFHGGGNFGDLYPVHQRFRERMLKRFARNRVVLMPQTVHFQSREALQACARCFRAHDNVTIMVRDAPSYTLARRHFSDQVYLVPDAAHALWGHLPAAAPTGPDTLFLYRRDQEAAGVPPAAAGGAEHYDWMDLIPAHTRKLFGLISRLHLAEGALDCDLRARALWYRQSDLLVDAMLRHFLRYGTVISSRLHACLLAALLQRQVRLVDNANAKLSRYFDAWLCDVPGVALQA